MFNLKGKNVLITGGSGYLGTAISEGLAAAGANIFIASKNQKKCQQLADILSQSYHVDCQGLFMDVSDGDSITACLADIHKSAKTIDILINNAYFGSVGTLETIKDKDWYNGIEGTIHNVYKCTRTVLPYMLAQKSGVIINVASMYGLVSPNPDLYSGNSYHNPPQYGAGKAAIIQYTRYLACHYGNKGIRANCISPGPFPNLETQKDEEFVKRLKERNPLNRIGRPEDLKGIMVLLASDASSYITGQNISIDGGWTAW
ncbi:SDR family oxidoreductase [bacterium LRH843]|nr:SDR family oxidoreductase [bacterium LRH843]